MASSGFGTAANPVSQTCEWVCTQLEHVHIDDTAIAQAAAKISEADLDRLSSPSSFDTQLHYVDTSSAEGCARTVQALFVVDALNFCFWPDPELEYEHLARGVADALRADPHALDASRLAAIDGEGVRALISGWKREVPLQEERARLLREVGQVLLSRFDGSAAVLVEEAKGSALSLLNLVTSHFPGFRDHAVYTGRQVFLYKRAQIFCGDVYGALGRAWAPAAFTDIGAITMFADYRVPVVLQGMGIMRLSPELADKVAAKQLIPPGSEEEVELRAATVVAVERLRGIVERTRGRSVAAVTLDWWLWECGEAVRADPAQPPFHRTLTIFY